MENILFSNTPAEELNKLVRTKIAEHLFLICHYEPCVNVFSEDAKLVLGNIFQNGGENNIGRRKNC